MFSHPAGREPTRSQWNPSEDIHDQALQGWSPSPGKLQKLLQMPEYSVFRGAQTFESNFFQVTKDGQFSNIHKHPNVVTIGILASCPKLLLPDLMIIAREKQETTNRNLKSRALEITRLIPLDLVEIFVHDANKRQLKMQLPTGDKYYLQLLVREEKADFLFECWLRLIYLMRLASGKIKNPENLPGKEPERPPSGEQAQHSVPKLKKESAGKESPKVLQPKSQKQSPPKWTSDGFTSRAPEQTSAAYQLKNVREPNFEKKKRFSSRISSESNPIPVTLQKSKKEICLLQKTKMASPLQKNPQAVRNEDPAAASRANNPGRPKSPGPPPQSQSPQQNQPASRVEPKAYSMSVGTGPSQAVQRKSKVESEKQSFPINPSHLANQSQNSKSNKCLGNPSMILGNRPQAFSNISPEKGHLTSQNDTGQQVHRVTMSVGVETSRVICQTVAVGPSKTIDTNLSNLPNKLLNASKSHKDQSKTIGKMEMSRKQVPVARNKVKTALSTAKEKTSVKFVTLYSILSSSLERLKKSSKDGTKRMTPKTSKHVTISGVIAKSRKSIVLQEEKTGKTVGVGTSNVVGLISKEAACVVAKKDYPPSSQPQKSLSKDAIKPQTPLARAGLLETDEATKLGYPIAAKEPGVTSITSQAPHKNTGVE
ncbi:uncharacterized protein LOC117666707 isoform X2 [Pantherophis guttatus]|uniref:Uncharacterized protein LOC117666707 isoform X2 n=1 Tax=Pantherophis guttatus TaxID=94885 RepID=A0A6P9BZ33_PANGU|nr:uncharacterized protein LOC117666707 isoform X2 [Pantherophis guttatus]